MKNVIMGLFVLCISSPAMADVVFKQTAGDGSACTKGYEKTQLAEYLRNERNGKNGSTLPPSCYKRGGIKSTTPTINNCKTAFQRNELSRYLNGKEMNPPKCYKPATWVGHTKSSASCNNMEKQQLRRYLDGKSGAVAPKCYK